MVLNDIKVKKKRKERQFKIRGHPYKTLKYFRGEVESGSDMGEGGIKNSQKKF